MTKFVIVQSDTDSGRGVRGRSLYRFLSIFCGRRAVRMVTSDRVRQVGPLKCDVLFIGVPSALGSDALTGIQYRQAVLFDYLDEPGTNWRDSNEDFLRSLTNTYLKAWVEPAWDEGLRFGVLPIRRHAVLGLYLRYLRATSWMRSNETRDLDMTFIGYPTGDREFNQRIQWLLDVRGLRAKHPFWGGFVARERQKLQLEERYGDLSDVYAGKRRVKFHTYFERMRHSKLALTPAGNARWSYRHYEAIYAGALPVSCDMRNTKTLIPLPIQGMIHVPDRESVTPYIERALELRRSDPELPAENIRFLEQYLRDGDYTRRKPELMDRFLAQLDI